jgi:hypothetical protein
MLNKILKNLADGGYDIIRYLHRSYESGRTRLFTRGGGI